MRGDFLQNHLTPPRYALTAATGCLAISRLDVCRIAERIMGWTACHFVGDTLVGTPRTAVPQYTRHLLDAWDVVDEMKRNGYSCQVSVTQIIQTPTAEFAKDHHHVIETASTEPLHLPLSRAFSTGTP